MDLLFKRERSPLKDIYTTSKKNTKPFDKDPFVNPGSLAKDWGQCVGCFLPTHWKSSLTQAGDTPNLGSQHTLLQLCQESSHYRTLYHILGRVQIAAPRKICAAEDMGRLQVICKVEEAHTPTWCQSVRVRVLEGEEKTHDRTRKTTVSLPPWGLTAWGLPLAYHLHHHILLTETIRSGDLKMLSNTPEASWTREKICLFWKRAFFDIPQPPPHPNPPL